MVNPFDQNNNIMNALKVETQQKIVQAAHEVFIEKGLQGARMQEIADRAGINKALLHYYFRSKEQLFDAVFQEIIGKVMPTFTQKIGPESNILDLITSFIGFYNDFFRKNPQFPQFFFHEIWQHPDRLAAFIKSQKVNPTELVKKAKSKIPPIIDSDFLPQHMVANMLGMCLFPHIARPLFQRLFFENDEIQYDQFLSERTEFLTKMLSGIDISASTELSQNPDENF
jgi:AcrR family transcriptional regulator